tara:strand:+ start:271 stop:546 length:276 start_codon:yes stop_codon:yes gene_type:complete
MYKKLKIFIYLFFFITLKSTIINAAENNPCDRILIKSKQFECLAAEKGRKIKEKLGFTKTDKIIKKLDEKKKIFDEKNKTLKDLFNNMKKK